MKENGHANGSAPAGPKPPLAGPPAAETSAATAASPPEIRDLAEACVRHVERALGVKLDYQPETLPLVDHYLEQGRRAVRAKTAVLPVLAQTLGAYFGEVVRRRYPSWWRRDGDDPHAWQIELEPVYLAFSPVRLVEDALLIGSEDAAQNDETVEMSQFELEEADRDAVAERLADLPSVREEEYFSLATRLEVIDIAVEAIRARRIAQGEHADAMLTPDDYA